MPTYQLEGGKALLDLRVERVCLVEVSRKSETAARTHGRSCYAYRHWPTAKLREYTLLVRLRGVPPWEIQAVGAAPT